MKRIGYINSKRAVEPNYSTWIIQAIYDTGVPLAESDDSLGIRVNGNVIFHDFSEKKTYIIDSVADLLATLVNEYTLFAGGVRYHSIADRYIMLIDNAFNSLVVQEGIAELWKRDVNEDKIDPVTETEYTLALAPIHPSLVAISPNGEWITVMVEEAGGNGLIFIYRGSG